MLIPSEQTGIHINRAKDIFETGRISFPVSLSRNAGLLILIGMRAYCGSVNKNANICQILRKP
jgi:hypothetical protein